MHLENRMTSHSLIKHEIEWLDIHLWNMNWLHLAKCRQKMWVKTIFTGGWCDGISWGKGGGDSRSSHLTNNNRALDNLMMKSKRWMKAQREWRSVKKNLRNPTHLMTEQQSNWASLLTLKSLFPRRKTFQ